MPPAPFPLPPLDADAAALLQAVRAAGIPRMESLAPAAARDLLAALRAKAAVVPPEIAAVQNLAAPGPDGPVPLRLYRPGPGPQARACLVYLHGGGWVLGNLDTHDVLCRQIVRAAGVTVIAVDYRLAPEHRFPAGLEDACAALVWIAREAAALDIDPGRIALGGDSAGGNLAAVMALMARDGALPPIRLQALLYPVTDLTCALPSHGLAADGMMLTGRTMLWFREHYLADPAEAHDWRASPLHAPDLAGVAPCYLVTAGADPLCDEGLAYAARLTAAGVRLTHEHYPGQMHGLFTAMPASATFAGALATFAAALTAALPATAPDTRR